MDDLVNWLRVGNVRGNDGGKGKTIKEKVAEKLNAFYEKYFDIF